jgi:hypothetical protein
MKRQGSALRRLSLGRALSECFGPGAGLLSPSTCATMECEVRAEAEDTVCQPTNLRAGTAQFRQTRSPAWKGPSVSCWTA